MRRLKRRYRVDDVPLALMPLFALYGYGIGLLFHLYCHLVRLSSVIVHEERARLATSPNHIFCAWHQYTWQGFVALPLARKQVWLAHPDWYMKPVHVLLGLLGVERVILGSTGRSGKAAADRLVTHLLAGASTTLAPDGPEGPAHQMRKGVLHLSAQSGVPIIPLRFSCSRSFTLARWDEQVVPLPFGEIRVCYGAPIWVRADAMAEQARELASALEAPGGKAARGRAAA